jgi:rhomboid family GlyGly-CTERM serine protease
VTPAWLRAPGRAWVLLALLLLAATLAPLDAPRWAWDRALLASEPWRWLSGALAHWTPQHAAANAAGAAVLAWVGWRAALPWRAALAWAAAGPLGQALLWCKPDLQQVAGLSGWLHAGVAVLCVGLLAQPVARARWVGAAVAVGLLVKLALEQPWGPALRMEPLWGAMPVVPWAHAAGALAGAVLGALALRPWQRSVPVR